MIGDIACILITGIYIIVGAPNTNQAELNTLFRISYATVTFLQILHLALAWKEQRELAIAARWVSGIALLCCLIFQFATAMIGIVSLFFVIACMFWNLYRAFEEMAEFNEKGFAYNNDYEQSRLLGSNNHVQMSAVSINRPRSDSEVARELQA
jgi:hypothetical protein